jgi:NDP-sugar pyrophosphorylase family protein
MQALILAGGEGTRLRPLTSRVPKPVVSLVDQPFISYMLGWLCRHGVDDVIMSCGFLAEGVRSVLGDGSDFGVRLRYVEEPRPLGTGGALKYAEDLLEERFFMLNGDVLTDIDLTAQLKQHEATGRRPVRLRARPQACRPQRQRLRREAGTGAVGRHESRQRRRLHPRAGDPADDGAGRYEHLDRT